jgi:hypothetical protein
MPHETPELQRAIYQLQRGYRLPISLVQTLQEQGFDIESLRAHFRPQVK